MNYKQKIFLILLVFVVVIIGLLLFCISPLVNKIKALSSELEENNKIIVSYKEKGSNYLAWIKDEYENVELEVLRINSSFIDSDKVIDFILAIEQAAALTSNYQEIEEIDSSEQGVLSFQVSLWGNFSNLVKFLVLVENMNYFTEISSLRTSKIGERDQRILKEKEINVLDGDIISVLEIKAYTK